MSPADRPPLTRRRVLAGGAVATVAWSNPTVTALGQVGSCVPSGGEPEQQLAIPGNGTVLDTWRSNLMINESRFYTNTSGAPQTIHPTTAAFESGRTGIPFTPFFVQILGDNNFIVLAVGTTRISANLGTNTNAFSDNPGCFTLPDGARLGIGFLDSYADGSGSVHSTVRWTNCCDQIWYSGGPSVGEAASVAAGSPPTPGNRVLTHLRRLYHIDYRYLIV